MYMYDNGSTEVEFVDCNKNNHKDIVTISSSHIQAFTEP